MSSAQRTFSHDVMDKQDLLARYDTQLRIEIEYPGVQKETFPHPVWFIKPAPGINFISYSRLDETNLDAIIQEQVAYFGFRLLT